MKRKIISVLGALLLAFGVFGSSACVRAAMPSCLPTRELLLFFEVNSGDVLRNKTQTNVTNSASNDKAL